MDRKLIGGALALLIIQIIILVADVDIYPGHDTENNSNANQIGIISQKKQSVKKRSQGSVVWEESENSDLLKNFDSVLTLENSSAQIQLKNDIKIDLQENTLIMLEPQHSNSDRSLRIRFSRGHLRSHNGLNKVQMASDEWEITTQPGATLSLKGLGEQNLEVEVTSGSVNVQNIKNPLENINIQPGTRLKLSEEKVESINKISEEIKFQLKTETRIYSHNFPAPYNIKWAGSAKQLRIIKPDQSVHHIKLLPNEQNRILDFNQGTHYLSLESDNSISKEIIVRAIDAPKVRYTSPLPRERFLISDKVLFSWLPLESAVRYQIELTNSDAERILIQSNKTQIHSDVKLTGLIQMRLFAEDELGFRIPPHYSQIFYILHEALSPPKLQSPETRAPANDDSASNFKFNWMNWLKFLINTAHAAEELPASTAPINKISYVTFSWHSVPGADFYNIEICRESDFLNPIVIAKANKEYYNWTSFTPHTYYWRVAAGSNSGRMGLFSEIAKIDLTDVFKKKSGELAPGVKLFTPKEVIIKPVAQEPQAPIVTAVAKSTPEDVQAKPGIWSYYTNFNLHYLNYSVDKDFSAGLSGFANLAVTAGAVLTNANMDKYKYSANYTQAKWSPEDKNILAFQNELSTNAYSLSAIYEKFNRDLGYGVYIESQPILSRAALEELKNTDVLFYGPQLSYSNQIASRLAFNSAGLLLFGDSLFAVGSSSSINYKLTESDWQPYVGGDFNFKLFFGSDSLSGFYLTTGLHLGIEW